MMKKSWQAHDLEGKGLQSINLAYLAAKKDLRKSYLLTALFPLGAHQIYLRNWKKAGVYLLLTVLLIATTPYAPFISALLGFAEFILVFSDIKRMESIISEYNKSLKIQLSLQKDNAAPVNFEGKYHDKSDTEQKSEQKILSFAEQEKLLNELNKQKNKNREQ